MRSRRSANEQVAEVTRRRLELLSAELAAIRPDPGDPPSRPLAGGSGEHPPSVSGRPGRHAQRPVGRGDRAGGWVEDRLPATLQGRVRLGATHVALVAVIVAAALGFLAWWSVRAADPGNLVPARSVLAPEPSGLASLATPQASPTPGAAPSTSGGGVSVLVVDVAGKVRHPGIVRLPDGSRVVDAIKEAGGARRGVDLAALNLARLLVDGEQVLVGMSAVAGVAPPAAAGPVASPGAALVNLNTATGPDLETLPGVGPVTAAAILQWRADHGAFSAVDELLEVSGIGDATLAEIAPFVTL